MTVFWKALHLLLKQMLLKWNDKRNMVLFSWVGVSLCVPALSLNILKNQVRNVPVPAAGGASPLPRPPYDALGGQRLQGSVFHRTALGEIDRPHKTLNSLGFKMTTNHPITGIAGKTCWSISENLKCGFLSAKPFELCLLRSERQGPSSLSFKTTDSILLRRGWVPKTYT